MTKDKAKTLLDNLIGQALSQEPTDTWSIKDVADTFKKHGLIREQEPCDDAISREAFITRYREWMKSEYGKIPDDDTLAIRVIKSLPPVTQKSGKWIPIYQGDEIINYRCSECELGDTNGSTNLYGWDYCRRCGADMREGSK